MPGTAGRAPNMATIKNRILAFRGTGLHTDPFSTTNDLHDFGPFLSLSQAQFALL